MSEVISGFPGVGKTYYQTNTTRKVLDSDSSKFSWIEKGVRHPDFPNNYISHIKSNLDSADVILVSSHANVRDALVVNSIPFTLIYPDKSIKEEYIQRFKNRGSDEKFIEMLYKNWDSFIGELDAQTGCKKIVLQKGQYLSDVLA